MILFKTINKEKRSQVIDSEYEIDEFPPDCGWIDCDINEYVYYDWERDQKILMKRKYKTVTQTVSSACFTARSAMTISRNRTIWPMPFQRIK
ncbi:MAG: hypothetical protein ABEH43_09750 [Flavobacteriales bacterium]